MKKVIDSGKARLRTDEELQQISGQVHYVTHFPVFNPSSLSTPVRILSHSAMKNENSGLSLNDLNSVFALLSQVVTLLSDHVKSVGTGAGPQAKEAGESAGVSAGRLHVVELDECRQCNFKGNLIINSRAFPERNTVSLPKTNLIYP